MRHQVVTEAEFPATVVSGSFLLVQSGNVISAPNNLPEPTADFPLVEEFFVTFPPRPSHG